MPLKLGESFGEYVVRGEIGRGGMAVVYEAEHTGLRKRVALKVLHATADVSQQRFLREGIAAARIRHEHIVDVYDTGVRDGTAFLVMERLHGESLASLVRREGPISSERLADIVLPVVSALAAAHEGGVVHRDIKPENIFLARSRRDELVPKVLDFGLALVTTVDGEAQRLTGSATLVGSVAYMSPEQVLNAAPIGPASDQYSLGVVMYECVTGSHPTLKPAAFATLSAILRGRVARPSAKVPSLDPRLDDLIVRAMAREASGRFPGLRALGAALLPLATPASRELWSREFGAAPEATPVAPAPRGRAWIPRAGVALSLATAAGLAAWHGLHRPALRPVSSVAARAVPARTSMAPEAATPHTPEAAVADASVVAPATPQRSGSSPVASRRASPRRAISPARVVPSPPQPDPPPPPQPAAPQPGAPWLLRTRY